MAIRVKFKRTELSDGVIETFNNVDYYVIVEDGTVELRRRTTAGKYKVVGHIHPDRWDYVLVEQTA